ncbi:DNA pilot protein [Antarctic microvirus COCH21_V_SP_13]|nr:DNA pilot protein [Antarctic microvirus COCH21_V_SP_13]
MPNPNNDAAISAAATVVGSTINSASVANVNRNNRKFSEKMYDKQKADNIAFWSQQNDYNTPAQQMARFKAAGLNPNLIYGQGSGGNAGPVSTPDVQPINQRSPEWGNSAMAGASMINQIYDLAIKQAQTNNLQAQNTVIRQDLELKRSQTDTNLFDLGFKQDLRETSAETQREKLRQTKTQTDLAINEDARRSLMNTTNVMEALSRMETATLARLNLQSQTAHTDTDTKRINADISRIKQNTANMRREGTLQQLDINLRNQGINPQDPQYMRILGQALSGLTDGTSTRSIIENSKKKISEWWNKK